MPVNNRHHRVESEGKASAAVNPAHAGERELNCGCAEGGPCRVQSGRCRCVSCGDIIGAYEPMTALLPAGPVLATSLLRINRVELADALIYHEACHSRASSSAEHARPQPHGT